MNTIWVLGSKLYNIMLQVQKIGSRFSFLKQVGVAFFLHLQMTIIQKNKTYSIDFFLLIYDLFHNTRLDSQTYLTNQVILKI